MRHASSTTATLLAVISAVAGCAAPHIAPAPVMGTVIGTLVFGGPGPVRPVPGQVTAINSAGAQSGAAVGDDGRFKMSLPPGSYQLTGHSPKVLLNGNQVQCGARHSVKIIAHKTTRDILVACTLI